MEQGRDDSDGQAMTTHANLAHRASRGIIVTMSGLWGRALLQMAATMVLARLLTPADFGLIAMVAAIIGVAELVRDFGMTGAVIQAQDLSESVWRSVVWLSILIGLALSTIVALCAPLIAALYGEPQLVILTLVMAPGIFLSGLSMPLQARATREMRFANLAVIDVVSMGGSVVAGIVAAFLGAGVWSLVIMGVTGIVVRLCMLWYIVRPSFGRPRISREAWPLISTGGSIFGAELLGYAEKNIDNVIIGAQLGPAVLGQYTRAYSIFLLPLQQMNGPLGRVALPVLSSLRNDGDRYRKYIRNATLVVGYLTLPTYAAAAGVAQPLISLLLGPGWEVAAVIFGLLAIAGFAQAIGAVRTWLYISLGHSHRQFAYDLVARPIVIAGYFVGIAWGGVYGLVITYAALSLIMLIPGFGFAIRGTFVRAGDIVGALPRPVFMAILTFAASAITSGLLDAPAILQVLAGAAAAAIVVAPLFLFRQYRTDIATLWGFVRQARRPKKSARPEVDLPARDGD